MYRLSAHIKVIGDRTWEFEHITSCVIERDIESLTTTCEIQLPRKTRWNNKEQIPLRRGDKIEVRVGYDDELQEVFSGFILDTGFKNPVTIKCEDYMYVLKTTPAVKRSYRNGSIASILADQNMPFDYVVAGEQNLGQYRVNAETIAELLGHWKDNGIRSFIKMVDGKPLLYCGVVFEQGNDATRQVFNNAINLISDSSLQEQRGEDVKIRLKVISLQPDNEKIRVEVGDPGGEIRTIHCYNKTAEQARAWGEQELKLLKIDGLTGSFTTFGAKIVDRLDVVGVVIDGVRKGKYQVKSNKITYGSGGLRQEITLGARVAI